MDRPFLHKLSSYCSSASHFCPLFDGMERAHFRISLVICIIFLLRLSDSLGINWGTVSSHRLPDKTIVSLLKDMHITKAKLFDADPGVINAFSGTNMELMVALPNDRLEDMAFSERAARRFVRMNITRLLSSVNIRYIAIGNEPFLKAYKGAFEDVTVPALKNMQKAMEHARIDHKVKLVVPLNADILTSLGTSGRPSQGIIRPDIRNLMRTILGFLDTHNAPFIINMYPFLSLQQDKHFPKDFAFFEDSRDTLKDGSKVYTNVFDASYDLLVSALAREGFPNMSIMVGEVGWPTDGDINANVQNAQKFNQQLIRHITSGKGTPLRPGPIDVYLFGLVDEDMKSILPGSFERHWGIYHYDGKPKYPLDITGQGRNSLRTVSGVKYLPSRWCILNPDKEDSSKLPGTIGYACTYADCTALVYGGSCNHIGKVGNASYAFNSYYQMTNQKTESCDFDGLGMITETDPSSGNCEFKVQIVPWSGSPTLTIERFMILLAAIFVYMLM